MKQSNWILVIGILVALLLISSSFLSPSSSMQTGADNQETLTKTNSISKKLSTQSLLKLNEWIRRYTRRL